VEYSFSNESIINGNNDTIEVCINDVILKEKLEENPKCAHRNK
jgi:hypothetical protein